MKAQTWEWAIAPEKDITGMGTGYSLALDNKDNLYVSATPIGHSYSGYQFTCSPSGGGLIAKHDPQGKVLWLIQVPDHYCAISSDSNGDLYAAGMFHKIADFCGNGNPDISLTQTSTSGPAAYIVRFSSAGALLWARKWDKWSMADTRALKTDLAGNSFVALHHGDNTPYNYVGGYTLIKYDKDGTLLWETEAVFNASPAAVDVDALGNCYVAGYFKGTVNFDNISLTAGNNEIFISKYNKDGKVIWAQKAAKGLSKYSAISLDNKGGFYLSGMCEAGSQFGNITINGAGGLFLVRYDTSGTALWADTYSTRGNGGSALATDLAGNCYLSSGFWAKTTLGVGVNSITLNSAKEDLFVAKFDLRGNLVWAVCPGGPPGGPNCANAIVRDAAGNCYITGAFSSTTTFGNSTLSIPLSSYHAMFLAKIKDLTFNPVSLMEQEQSGSLFQVFPNPGGGVFKISYSTELEASDAMLFLRNISGQLLWQETFPIHHRQLEEQIDLGNLPKGLYLLELVAGKHHQVRKLVLN